MIMNHDDKGDVDDAADADDDVGLVQQIQVLIISLMMTMATLFFDIVFIHLILFF